MTKTIATENEYEVFDIGYGYLKRPDSLDNEKVEKEKSVIGELGDSLNADDLKGIDIINVDGTNYVIGDDVYKLGKKPLTANNPTDRALQVAYKVLALYSIAKSKNTSVKRNVLTGLPYINLSEADQVKNLLEGEHTVVLNNKENVIIIEKVTVTSQGLGTYYYLVKKRGQDVLKKKILLVDLGFGTINYLPLNNGDIDKNTVKTNRDLGIQDAYKKIVEGINLEFKTNYKYYNVDDLLEYGVPIQDKDKGKTFTHILEKPYVTSAFTTYAKDVWTDIQDKYDTMYREGLDEIVFGGGTATRVERFLAENKVQYCSFMDNAQDAQVLGYVEIAKKLRK
jgi:hypothetical protein